MSEEVKGMEEKEQEAEGSAESGQGKAPEGVAAATGSRAGKASRSGGRGRFVRRRKYCKFCADKSLKIDHKDPDLLRQFVTERYKIIPARITGTCAFHQRRLAKAIKRARILALLPFTPLHHD